MKLKTKLERGVWIKAYLVALENDLEPKGVAKRAVLALREVTPTWPL